MIINNEILEILTEYKIAKDDGICYLLSLYYGYKPSYIDNVFKQRMHITKIYELDKNSIKWNIPLFEGQETAFEWVKTEYCEMFKEYNPTRSGNVREATARIKKLFAKNPDIRKEDVVGATKMYLLNTDYKYIMNPHYFIEKGDGAMKTSTILTWIDKYKLEIEQKQSKNSIINTMQ